MVIRPTAGSVAFISQPIEGAWKSVYKTPVQKQEQERRIIRMFYGSEDVNKSTEEDRTRVIDQFTQSRLTLKERKGVEAQSIHMA